MGAIKLLPEGVWSRIAAGEVVERPVSAVKEMVENSLDAGAKRIRVKLWDGGRVRIVVEDDGSGIEFSELPLALTPHATSKISGIEDLEAIHTLGYRGEALASLAAVGRVEIRSKTKNGGGVIRAYEGRVTDHAEVNCSPGTRVQVDEIFANLPARRKFLKSASGELRRVAALLRDYAICRPEAAFALEHDGRTVFSTDGAGTRRRAIEQLWGSEPKIRDTEAKAGRIRLECWWQPRPGPGGRSEIASFVNGRAVSDPVIKGAVSAAAREMTGGWALFFAVDPSLVDVNIHPAKAEIRFRYPSEVFEAVKEAASKLAGGPPLNIHTAFSGTPVTPGAAARGFEGGDFEPDFSGGSVKNSAASSFRTASYRAGASSVPNMTKMPETEHYQSAFSRVEAPDFEFGDAEKFAHTPNTHNAGNIIEDREASAAYLGQLASGYLVFDGPEGVGLAIVDPHAAHERVGYERIRAAVSGGERSQQLLIPSPVPPTLRLEAEEKRDFLESVGFAFETAEGGTRLTAVPYIPEASVPPDALLRGSLAALRESGDAEVMEFLWRAWASMACKEAVKVTTRLTTEEALALWKDLRGCEQPLFCPHGRPAVLTISAVELRKHFGRE